MIQFLAFRFWKRNHWILYFLLEIRRSHLKKHFLCFTSSILFHKSLQISLSMSLIWSFNGTEPLIKAGTYNSVVKPLQTSVCGARLAWCWMREDKLVRIWTSCLSSSDGSCLLWFICFNSLCSDHCLPALLLTSLHPAGSCSWRSLTCFVFRSG